MKARRESRAGVGQRRLKSLHVRGEAGHDGLSPFLDTGDGRGRAKQRRVQGESRDSGCIGVQPHRHEDQPRHRHAISPNDVFLPSDRLGNA